jgi:hypothetical protein
MRSNAVGGVTYFKLGVGWCSYDASTKRSFSVIENERFRLVFAKTGPINSGAGLDYAIKAIYKKNPKFSNI